MNPFCLDNRFQISEIVEALPVERSFLQQFLGSEITHMDVDIIFDHYDKDGSGQIQHEEISNLVRDLLRKPSQKNYHKQLRTVLSKSSQKTLWLVLKKHERSDCTGIEFLKKKYALLLTVQRIDEELAECKIIGTFECNISSFSLIQKFFRR